MKRNLGRYIIPSVLLFMLVSVVICFTLLFKMIGTRSTQYKYYVLKEIEIEFVNPSQKGPGTDTLLQSTLCADVNKKSVIRISLKKKFVKEDFFFINSIW